MTTQPSSPPKRPSNPWIETAKAIGLGLVAALGIRTFIASVFYIPSDSMEPTLEVNDRLIVEKLGYHFGQPQRGDIIVFDAPPAAIDGCRLPTGQHVDFIKRVVGLPNEEVAVRDGKVFINGKAISEPYIADAERRPRYQMQPITVPENSVLVLGDNRNNSCDGHIWGALPEDRIVGRAVLRIWPFSRLGQP